MRIVNLALGFIMLALGVIGAFLPVMPTTIFVILAAYFFARSSPRLEAWLVNHKQFGPHIVAWRRNRAISARGKIMSLSGMALGYAIFLIGAQPRLEIAAPVALFFIACATYVFMRPDA